MKIPSVRGGSVHDVTDPFVWKKKGTMTSLVGSPPTEHAVQAKPENFPVCPCMNRHAEKLLLSHGTPALVNLTS